MPSTRVSYDAMEQQAQWFDAGHQEITNQLKDLMSKVDQLTSQGFQTDEASLAFYDAYSEFTTGLNAGLEGLLAMSAYLRKANQAYRDLDSALAKANYMSY